MTVILLAVGVVFADDEAATAAVRLCAAAQGIGRAAALAWQAAGHKRLSRR